MNQLVTGLTAVVWSVAVFIFVSAMLKLNVIIKMLTMPNSQRAPEKDTIELKDLSKKLINFGFVVNKKDEK